MSKRKPLNEGYQPNNTVKRGYQPKAIQQSPKNPPSGGSNVKPPQSSEKK